MKFLRSVQFWLWMIVLLGVSLRLREFLSFRSLWLDEVALLLQIKRRSYERLLLDGPGGNQGARGSERVYPVRTRENFPGHVRGVRCAYGVVLSLRVRRALDSGELRQPYGVHLRPDPPRPCA